MKPAITALAIGLSACLLHGAEYHVSPTGADGNAGSGSRPFRTISAAAKVALPGDIITVHEGIYRERVNPPRGGTSDDNRITYQAAPGEQVVIKGSEEVKGWKKLGNDTWKLTLPSSFFGDFNPYDDAIGGEWYATPRDGFDRHTGAVYLNGRWLDEAKTLEPVLAPMGRHPLWIAEVTRGHTTIRAQFKDVDPNKELVEINVRQSVFYPDLPGRSYITVRGFTMCHAATPWSGAMSEQVGLIGTHWSKGWVIEDNMISHSMNTGITLGRYDLGCFGIDLPPATAPGFVRSCELALAHGWSKEKIGGHVVRNNHISHCEKNGIHGSLGAIFSTIEGNTIRDIATRRWISGPDVAGLKLLASHDTLIRNNHIHHCGGTAGVWLDWMAQGTRVSGNLLHDNGTDLFMEVNHGPFLIDHNLFLSGHSLQDWSQGGAYAHNLIAGAVGGRKETRETPFFTPHAVAGMRLSNIQHKDLRFHNNLFVGSGGLAGFDQMAENLQAAGNVYLSGAQPVSREQGAVVAPDFKPGLSLEEKPGGWWLTMAVDPAWLSGQKRAIVTTEALGRAGVPDALFEQSDGSPYRIDTDYFGNKRDSENPAPGAFELRGDDVVRFKVWPAQHPGASTPLADAAGRGRPNFVLIIGDDISADDFGCYGHPHIRTPNVDRLAAGGMRFTNAYLTTSQCSPTRCSVITGRYPHNTGAPELHMPLPDGQVVFPAILREAGYHTAAAGKWHIGEHAKSAFDIVVDSGPGGEERWVECLQKRPQDKPFLMWFASHDAHRGWAPDKGAPPHQPEDAVIPPYLIDTAAVRKDMAQYYDEVQRLDRHTGLVVEELRRQGVLDNTCIIFMADNGRPFPRCKTRLHDSGIKTPLVVHWPAGIDRAGSVCDSLVSVIDLAPTMLGLANLAPPPSFQGLGMQPLLADPSASIREFVFAEHNWHGQIAHERMVRHGDFVYIRNAHPQLPQICGLDSQCPQQELRAFAQQGKLTAAQMDPLLEPRPAEELFELGTDPHQLQNLAGQPERREVLNRLGGLVDDWQRRTGDTVPPLDKATPDRYDRRTGKPLLGRGGRPEGGVIPGQTSGATTINDPGPR